MVHCFHLAGDVVVDFRLYLIQTYELRVVGGRGALVDTHALPRSHVVDLASFLPAPRQRGSQA